MAILSYLRAWAVMIKVGTHLSLSIDSVYATQGSLLTPRLGKSCWQGSPGLQFKPQDPEGLALLAQGDAEGRGV